MTDDIARTEAIPANARCCRSFTRRQVLAGAAAVTAANVLLERRLKALMRRR